jgi:phosphopantothenoylcysteine decarboxylase/phosphopantothenate--cysteine ligase
MESKPLVALGVTGCIGAYKSAEILRRLQDGGCVIQPVLTTAACNFITPLTLQTLAGRPAITGLFEDPQRWEVEHITLSDAIDVLLVAPATANILAKFAHGIADDFLSTLYLSVRCPVVVAPAMNEKMWRHPAVAGNVKILQERGVSLVGPGRGYLACGWEGEGRLAALEDIVDAALYALRAEKTLSGRKVVITAGPTAEDIDPIRCLTNRSSGRMGFALTWEAGARGADVVLISGPTSLRPPYDIRAINVRSAEEMHGAVAEELSGADIVIMAAAVADYRPVDIKTQKIKKAGDMLSLELVPTIDILSWIGEMKRRPLLVGFAAESENLKENALQKLRGKGADMIVANPIAGPQGVLGAEESEGMIFGADGAEINVPRCSKKKMAEIIFDQIEKRLAR